MGRAAPWLAYFGTDSYFRDFSFVFVSCLCLMTNIKVTNMKNTAGKSASGPRGLPTSEGGSLSLSPGAHMGTPCHGPTVAKPTHDPIQNLMHCHSRDI